MAAARSSLRIRPFGLADAPAIEPWLAAPGLQVPPGPRGRGWAARVVAAANSAAIVAEIDDRLVGFLRLSIGPDEIGELTLAVAPAARRRGVGGRLLAAALDKARGRGLRALDAAVDAANAPALAFFAAHGFEAQRSVGGHDVLRRFVHDAADAEPLDIG
jgi:ribosomal-protein-alanine N-acetyltransferase